VFTGDRDANVIHRQDETSGEIKTNFQHWDSNTSDTTGSWNFQHGAGDGGSMQTCLTIKQNGDMYMKAAAALYMDGGADTYIQESAANTLLFATGGTARLTLNSTKALFAAEVEAASLDINGNADISGTLNIHDEILTTAGGSLLEMYQSSWSTASNHDILYQSWNTNTDDFIYLKSPGNSTNNHGIAFIGDNVIAFGRTQVEQGNPELTSAAAPLNDNWLVLNTTSATFAGTIGSGAITSTGKITGTELEGTSLDINGNADISGDLTLSGVMDILMVDNSGAAVEFKQGSDLYMRFITTNGSEHIEVNQLMEFGAGINVGGHTISNTLIAGDTFVDDDNRWMTSAAINDRFAQINADTTGTAAIATTITVADESSDTSCNVLFATAATGNLGPKSGSNLTFNSSSGVLTATGFAGALTGNVTGNASGSSGSCTGNAATATSAAKLTDGGGISTDPGTSNLIYTGALGSSTSGLFTASDNSNSIITVNRHVGNYNSQLGFSSNGNLYYRKFSNSTAYTTQGWKTIAFTDSDISGDTTGNAATATEATNITATANNSTNETVYPTFVDGATGTQGIETDTGFTYNPSSGTLTTNVLSVASGITHDGDINNKIVFTTDVQTFSCDGNESLIIRGDAVTDAPLFEIQGAGAGNQLNIGLLLKGKTNGNPIKMKMQAPNDSASVTGAGILSYEPDADTFNIGQSTTHNSMAISINNDDNVTVTNVVTLSGGFILDGNTITGVDDSGEFTNDDAHIMTSAGVEDKILGYGYTTNTGDATLAGTQTFSGAKTFSAAVTVSNSTASTSKTTGAVKVTGGVGIQGALNVGADVTAFASSDRRYKDNLQAITNPIDKVKSLTGYTFTWNDKHEQFNGNDDIGVVAQEVEKVLPEIVDTRDNGYKAVKYEKMVALLIEAVKDQQKQIDELKEKCNGCS
jgi:hypothetical protein